MKKKLTLKQIFQGSSSALGIKEIFFNVGFKREIQEIKIRYINKIPLTLTKESPPFIGIISLQALKQYSTIEVHQCKKIPEYLFNKKLLFLFITNSSNIPIILKNNLQKHKISAAASEFNRYYLKSCLTKVLREKMQETVYFHGVVFESNGRGILLTGQSGIGKTTAVLDYVRKNNNYWVADDLVMVSKNKKQELIAESHKRIKNLIHTSKTGIILVHKILNPDRIKKRTRLGAIIEITRGETSNCQMTRRKKKILNQYLPCLHIKIPQGRYFDKNLLKKCLEEISED